MKHQVSKLWSGARLVAALGVSLGLAFGLAGAGGCAVASDEPAVAEQESVVDPTTPVANIQIVFACFGADGIPVGLPSATLDGCRAKCPAGGGCERCVLRNNAVTCE